MLNVAVEGIRDGCGRYEEQIKIFIYSSLRINFHLIERTFLPKS